MFSEPKTKMFLKTSGSMMVLLALVFVGLKIYENRSLFINWRPTIFDFWLFFRWSIFIRHVKIFNSLCLAQDHGFPWK